MFVSFLVFEQFIRVNTVFVVNTSVPLSNTNKFGTFLNKEFGSPVTDITKTLNAESLSNEPLLDPENFAHLSVVQNLFGSVEHTETS